MPLLMHGHSHPKKPTNGSFGNVPTHSISWKRRRWRPKSTSTPPKLRTENKAPQPTCIRAINNGDDTLMIRKVEFIPIFPIEILRSCISTSKLTDPQ